MGVVLSLVLACLCLPTQAILLQQTQPLQTLQPLRIIATDGNGSREIAAPSLPYAWDKLHRTAGSVRFEFELGASQLQQRSGLLAQRIGATYRVWLDGQLIDDHDSGLRGYANFGNVPRMIEIPPVTTLGAESRLLAIEVFAPVWSNSGLSGLYFGSHATVQQAWVQQYERERYPAIGVAVLSGLLGLLGWMLWWFQRELLYLAYAISESVWSLRTVAVYMVDEFPIPWPWWSIAIVGGWALAIGCMFVFILALIDRYRRPWKQLIGLHAIVCCLVLLLLLVAPQLTFWVRTPFRLSVFALAGIVGAILFWHTWRTREREALAMSSCGIVILLVAAHDLVTVTLAQPGTPASAWLVYVWPIFGITVAWLLARRLHQSSVAQRAHGAEMRDKLMRQAAELEQSFARQSADAQTRVIGEERQRVLQDMHDGVGHELLGALQLAQDGHHDTGQVAQQIQRALDHLKLSVDVLQDGAQDISTMLGSLRYRLGPRLLAAGIDLAWSVDALSHPPNWTTRHTRELQMLLYEAFSNLVQHSGATAARFLARMDGQGIRIELADNGRGLAPGGSPGARTGHGLASMRARAARLQAQLSLEPDTEQAMGGLCVALRIPAPDAAATAAELPQPINAAG